MRRGQQRAQQAQAFVLVAQLEQLLLRLDLEFDGRGHRVGVERRQFLRGQLAVGGLHDELLVEVASALSGGGIGLLLGRRRGTRPSPAG